MYCENAFRYYYYKERDPEHWASWPDEDYWVTPATLRYPLLVCPQCNYTYYEGEELINAHLGYHFPIHFCVLPNKRIQYGWDHEIPCAVPLVPRWYVEELIEKLRLSPLSPVPQFYNLNMFN